MNPRPKKLSVLRWVPDRWVLTQGATDRKAVHLTFDDGPHPEHTPRLLNLLAAHGARATFFVIGQQAERHPELLRAIVAAGHRLGNHSWSHPVFERLPLVEQMAEIERTERFLSEFDGAAMRDFRPPRGVMPPGMVLACIRQGRRIAHWSYDSLDYSRRPVEELVASAQRYPVRAGDVVLMHDDSDHAAHLLERMLPAWSAEGFVFERLPDAA